MTEAIIPPFNRIFSHLYVEKRAFSYVDCKTLMNRFPRAEVVTIDNYKQVFNRPRQDWRDQKLSQKLVIAVREGEYLYDGSAAAPSFGHKNYFYNTLAMNCVYDCSYCYLQGMYPSANLVMFVNNEDYLEATRQKLLECGDSYVCISYDTDLLALEDLLPQCKRWIEFTRNNQALTIELRTKSAAFSAIEEVEPCDRVILAWTISPTEIISRYEIKTPALSARIKAIKQAILKGWKIRLCVDPILHTPGWNLMYQEMIEQLAASLPLENIHQVSLGVFRMNSDFLATIQKQRQDSDVIFGNYESVGSLDTYPEKTRLEMLRVVGSMFEKYMPKDHVLFAQ